MSKEVIEHPCSSTHGFPFVELSKIKPGTIMRSLGGVEEVVASEPIEVRGGEGSYFNAVHQEGDRILVSTMKGRSDKGSDTWVYAGHEVTEIPRESPDYNMALRILKQAA